MSLTPVIPEPETLRHDWQRDEILALLDQPLSDLIYGAQRMHRRYFDPNRVQMSRLLSIKTGACPEDCGYCPQSAHHATDLEPERLLPLDEVTNAARAARDHGATRFCMGAAWRQPTDRHVEHVAAMVEAVRGLGLETCLTLGMLTAAQAERLRAAGLDYYNHNLDTSPEFYGQVITTRTYAERLETLANVRDVGIHVCSGGILGMGESRSDRAGLLEQLANLPRHPESVPINLLVQVPGTPLYGTEALDPLELVRVVATARLLMPGSYVRLAAGRTDMDDATQALCLIAGANSLFYGDRLLTTDNPGDDHDHQLLGRLGMAPEETPNDGAVAASG